MQALKSVWDFFQNEILGMKWLNQLIGNLLEACGLSTETRLGGSVQFFIYDTIKIILLLGVLILIISYIQSYFPPERTKKILGRFRGIGANMIAALLGTATPFCSCSSIPIFIGFTSAGLPLGVTFSFFNFFSYGRPRLSCTPYEHIRLESGNRVCSARTYNCCCRREFNRKTTP